MQRERHHRKPANPRLGILRVAREGGARAREQDIRAQLPHIHPGILHREPHPRGRITLRKGDPRTPPINQEQRLFW